MKIFWACLLIVVNLNISAQTPAFKIPEKKSVPETKEDRKKARLHKKHAAWHDAIVIRNANDSLRVKIKETDLNQSNQWFSLNTITVANALEREFTMSSDNFKAFIVWGDSGVEKYVSLSEDGYEIYRIYVEGKWMVLSSMARSGGTYLGVGGGFIPGPPKEKFFLYCNASGSNFGPCTVNADNPNFDKKLCKEVFSKCPDLFDKVKNKSSLYFDDLKELATGFNRCLKSPQVAYPKYGDNE